VEKVVNNLIKNSKQLNEEDKSNCDIIIPVYNQLDYTKQCLDSIIRCTAYPHKIIVVDDASGQETKAYLRLVAAEGRIVLRENPQNMGWVASVNEGIKMSTAPYLCIMNNDVEVYPGWLYEMINVAKTDEKIGIVNPTWEIPKYSRLGRKDFYSRVVAPRSAEYTETDWARGFCFLAKRRVIEAIGGLDPAFSPGYYDDWDFSLRAAKAGFIIVRAKGAFVWHYKNVSYKKKLGEINFNKILAEREDLFRRRWGNPARILVIVGPEGVGEPGKLEELLLALLRSQAKVTLVSSDGKIVINHTNCRVSRCWDLFLYVCAMIKILDNVRLGPHKRYSFIIGSGKLAGFFGNLFFIKNNFSVLDLESVYVRGVDLLK
jgi:GT2 family glycosyltransferase